MLEALPVGLIAFPGSGVSANLADKARKLGIPVWRHGAEVPRERRPSRITGCSRWGSRHSVQHYRMGGERRFRSFAGRRWICETLGQQHCLEHGGVVGEGFGGARHKAE